MATVGANVTEYEDSDPPLQEGTTYKYRVRAFNSRGHSGWSNEVVQQTGRLPEAPTNLQVLSYGVDFITIGWEDRSDNETAFNIEVKIGTDGEWQPRARLTPDSVVYEDTGLISGEIYSYRVRAENQAGFSAWAGPITQRTASPPPTPRDFSVVDVGLDWILLAWEDVSDLETSYEVQRCCEEGDFQPLATLAADTTMYADTSLPPDTECRYRVRALNSYGSSPWTEVVVGRTGKLPRPPENLRIVETHLSFLTLKWEDVSDNEQGFLLERKTGEGAWAFLIRLPANWDSYTDHGLEEGTRYTYRVRAFNRFGFSDWSEEAGAETGSLPTAPSNLQITGIGLHFLEIAWEDRSENELYFEIEVKPEAGGAWESVGTTPSDSTTFRILNLNEGTAYLVRVRAWNRFGPSPYSEEAQGQTGSLPEAPSNLRETAWSESFVELSWEDVDSELAYLIMRKALGADSYEVVAEIPADTTSWTDTGLQKGEVYEYVVVSRNEFGNSEPSNSVVTCSGIKILEINPTAGNVEGGDALEIRGIHFTEEAVVFLGESQLLDLQLAEGSLKGITPAWPRAESVDVRVVQGSLAHTVPKGFHFARNLLRGDVNGNRFLSLADVVMLLSYLFRGGAAPYCTALADANNDGNLNLADAIFLLDYLFGNGPPPIPERVDCR